MNEPAGVDTNRQPGRCSRFFYRGLAVASFGSFVASAFLAIGFIALTLNSFFDNSTKQEFVIELPSAAQIHIVCQGGRAEIGEQPQALWMIEQNRAGRMVFARPPESAFLQESTVASFGWLSFSDGHTLWGFESSTTLVACVFFVLSLAMLAAIWFSMRRLKPIASTADEAGTRRRDDQRSGD